MPKEYEHEILGNRTKILLEHKGSLFTTWLDTEDWLKYKHYSMCINPQKNNLFYVTITIIGQQFRLHRLLVQGDLIDHQDGNGLNNCKDNLVSCTNAENMQNRTTNANSNSTSGVRGIGFKKQTGQWTAQVKIDGKKKHLGTFNSIQEAEKVVKEYRAMYMPFSKEART